jgi:hypothetical protein
MKTLMIVCIFNFLQTELPKWGFISENSNMIITTYKNLIVKKGEGGMYIFDNQSSFYFDKNLKAQFPGGMDSLDYFKRKNLVYPPHINFYAIVSVAFVVNMDGSISHIGLIGSCGEASYDEAALKFVQKMPLWNPAILDGEPVNSLNTLIVRFNYK